MKHLKHLLIDNAFWLFVYVIMLVLIIGLMYKQPQCVQPVPQVLKILV